MQLRTRPARLGASLLSVVVAVLAFAVPSRGPGTVPVGQILAAPQRAVTGGGDTAHSDRAGPRAPDLPRVVHATAAHPHHGHIPHPPYPGTTAADRAPHRSAGGPVAHPPGPAWTRQHADTGPRPRGPPPRMSSNDTVQDVA
ncbi:hypothetical protein [Streptomyces spectabilis]|uniref:Uncharacterized protein n=1 Tax=Streptomyces spectabilis TaxID=68270 RepID=A0A5P2X174_STRST|nr:hypothetical protein [Streptomyces spectabilis]MBB5101366.1 hypothetical protein [Streptomyces spectabilis]MCI3900562.1 hypothetical protein [Streptomyces spectabilis]QEV58128.1 hypothetical protein CP982_04860 [Streptomyces spectabilis]GGV10932.1 hypothetical protein GCM10010245_20470 [Streptomyces spectabilis]